ncbi:MAG: hypothetical protein MSC50_08255 [Campylobacter sp.]|uniref:hypothetical protein n=1 Tax=Campylobacter sp. TaxID=205 RepID=UPI002AA8F83B|nr:hypothetical protein [Campylobacter sp.]MCI6580247.1 hypothetical protein [Campylobacter sp.]MCI7015086.1 hypothetical protein [Campylobacter sp.]
MIFENFCAGLALRRRSGSVQASFVLNFQALAQKIAQKLACKVLGCPSKELTKEPDFYKKG